MNNWKLSIVVAFSLAAFAVTGWAAAGGTALSEVLGIVSSVCLENGSANVTLSYTLNSTAAADAATVTYTVDGGNSTLLTVIASGNVTDGGGWTYLPQGGGKTAGGQFTLNLADGSHVVEVCAVQDGANGREPKSTCQTINVVVDCSANNPCGGVTRVFGELPNNKNVCKNNAPIEVNFSGNFGNTATLSITGPNGFSSGAISVGENGESCNYHYNWSPASNGGAGTYVFSVDGGQFTFSADLSCTGGGKP